MGFAAGVLLQRKCWLGWAGLLGLYPALHDRLGRGLLFLPVPFGIRLGAGPVLGLFPYPDGTLLAAEGQVAPGWR